MKNIILFLSASIFLIACGNSADEQKSAQQKKEADNIAVVEKYIKAVETKDAKVMSDLLSDDYMGYGPSVSDSINKTGALENWKSLTETLYEKIEYKRTVYVTATVAEGPHPGEYVSDWANLVIHFKDGRGPVTLNMNAVYRIENGKITLSRTFYNEADVMRQLGYEFYPKETK